MTEAETRYVDYYLQLVQRDREDWQTIAADLDHIRRAWELVAADPERTFAFFLALRLFQERQGLGQEALAWAERGHQAAQLLGRGADEAIVLNQMGVTHLHQGEPRRALAYFEQVLPLCEAIGDRSGQA